MNAKTTAKRLALIHQACKREFDSKSLGDDRRLEAQGMVAYSNAMDNHLTETGVAYTPPELPGETGYWTHVVKIDGVQKSMIHKEEDK